MDFFREGGDVVQEHGVAIALGVLVAVLALGGGKLPASTTSGVFPPAFLTVLGTVAVDEFITRAQAQVGGGDGLDADVCLGFLHFSFDRAGQGVREPPEAS